jgi:hypothetical protein
MKTRGNQMEKIININRLKVPSDENFYLFIF